VNWRKKGTVIASCLVKEDPDESARRRKEEECIAKKVTLIGYYEPNGERRVLWDSPTP